MKQKRIVKKKVKRRIKKKVKIAIGIMCIVSVFIVVNNFIKVNRESSISNAEYKDEINIKGENEKKESTEIVSKLPMAKYEGTIEHVFVHPLIVYPELAYDGDSETETLSKWFVTTKEFKNALEELYKNNYILVSYRDIYEEKELDGKTLTVRKELMLPVGKKPLIISVDDLNANTYMLGNGITEKLVLDTDGEIAGYIKNPQGKYVISKDTEIVPVLEGFLKKHPDFSHNGAKGTIALTGFEGILGYRTNRESLTREEELKQCKVIVDKLKKDGWEFASHSYGHPNLGSISLNRLKDDTAKWANEVKSIVGDTNIYITPYGSWPTEESGGLKYLQESGFKIFAGVGPISYEKIYKDQNLVITDRRNLDGGTLLNKREKFLDLYDANNIIDYEGRKNNY